MMVTYFMDSFSGMEFSNDQTYMASEGVFFDNAHVDLDFYLKGIVEVSFVGKGLFKTLNLMNKLPTQVFCLNDFSLFDSSYLMDGENQYISRLYGSVLTLYKKDDGDFKETYISLSTGKRVIPIAQGADRYIDETFILVERSGFLYCSDWNGELLWKREFSGIQGFYRPNFLFESVNNGILINMSELSDGTGAIVYLDKMTGNVIWEKPFSARVEDSYLVNNKIYCCVGNKMMIMNLQGDIEREFIADIPDQQYLSFWTDEKLLYVFAAMSNQVLAYTMDGQFIKRYQLPDHPAIWHGTKVYRSGNTNYMRLGRGHDYFVGVENGLLTWVPEDILAGKELELEERPSIIIMTIKEEDGTQSYYLNIPSTDIHELLRHTEIEVRRLLSMRAKPYYFENKETRNKKFNGQVKLLIDPSIGEGNHPYLDMLVKRCNYFASSSFMKSGNGKKDIEVSWVFSDQL